MLHSQLGTKRRDLVGHMFYSSIPFREYQRTGRDLGLGNQLFQQFMTYSAQYHTTEPPSANSQADLLDASISVISVDC